ncbi:MAG: type IV pilus assembly protein PilM [Pirellulales bacterium]|nr:type IV pilus assembly protein PilM [Pirellulales bacterium]
MLNWSKKYRHGPIGVDIGTQSVKLIQLDAEHTQLREASRWDLPPASAATAEHLDNVIEALRQAREGRDFRGREAIFCLNSANLFVQNIRVPQAVGDEFRKIVNNEAAARIPFEKTDAEIRYIEADNVRQGDAVRKEVILMACQNETVDRILKIAEGAGLVPTAIDVEPAALLRCYRKQLRRDADQSNRMMFINMGASTTTVVIARGGEAMFVKYIDVGGKNLDEAVSRNLGMKFSEAAALRRHNGDRRADQRDPEIARSVAESTRSLLERLAGELSMCIRYYSVTFRGQPLKEMIIGGGEASDTLAEWLSSRLDMKCEVGNPLRSFRAPPMPGRAGQWDVATGLALRS